MRTYVNQAQNHLRVALLIALLFLLLLLGAAFVLAEQHHHCTGEHCASCAAVAHTVAYLKAGTTSVTLAVVIALWLFLATYCFASDAGLPYQPLACQPQGEAVRIEFGHIFVSPFPNQRTI
ncbi:MAG: hypothetical protein R2881_08870 [Eubacteriales bacterium]